MARRAAGRDRAPLRAQGRHGAVDAGGDADRPDAREDQVDHHVAQQDANGPVAGDGQVEARAGALDDAQEEGEGDLEARVGDGRRAHRDQADSAAAMDTSASSEAMESMCGTMNTLAAVPASAPITQPARRRRSFCTVSPALPSDTM